MLARILRHVARDVKVSIGDDAAVLRGRKTELVWTVDVCVEGVHFVREWLRWEDVGWRSLHAAASDLAAMGARPVAALSSLVVPRDLGRTELQALVRGQAQAARALGCPVVGGNLSRGQELSITTTVLGDASRPVLRTGARPGQELWLVGEVGLAAAGRLLLERGEGGRRCIQAWRRPRARIEEGQVLRSRAAAMIDVSDGLAGDLRQLADASRVKMVVEQPQLERALPVALSRAAESLGVAALDLALYGGEDYALVAAGLPRRRAAIARRIGRVEAGHGAFLEPASGHRIVALGDGFDHLS
jgi:thiamine-monophosphate kinase